MYQMSIPTGSTKPPPTEVNISSVLCLCSSRTIFFSFSLSMLNLGSNFRMIYVDWELIWEPDLVIPGDACSNLYSNISTSRTA